VIASVRVWANWSNGASGFALGRLNCSIREVMSVAVTSPRSAPAVWARLTRRASNRVLRLAMVIISSVTSRVPARGAKAPALKPTQART